MTTTDDHDRWYDRIRESAIGVSLSASLATKHASMANRRPPRQSSLALEHPSLAFEHPSLALKPSSLAFEHPSLQRGSGGGKWPSWASTAREVRLGKRRQAVAFQGGMQSWHLASMALFCTGSFFFLVSPAGTHPWRVVWRTPNKKTGRREALLKKPLAIQSFCMWEKAGQSVCVQGAAGKGGERGGHDAPPPIPPFPPVSIRGGRQPNIFESFSA